MFMRLTRKQQLYASTVGVGLLALTLDRTVFSPQPADGAPDDALVTSTPTSDPVRADPAPAPVSPILQSRSAVANRLARAAQERGLATDAPRDAFLPGESWFPKHDSAAADKTREEMEAGFRARHRLLAIVNGEKASYVLFEAPAEKGDEPQRLNLKLGDELGGFTIKVIGRYSVTLRKDDASVTLTLHEQTAPNAEDDSAEVDQGVSTLGTSGVVPDMRAMLPLNW
jgi:hypothetical protein